MFGQLVIVSVFVISSLIPSAVAQGIQQREYVWKPSANEAASREIDRYYYELLRPQNLYLEDFGDLIRHSNRTDAVRRGLLAKALGVRKFDEAVVYDRLSAHLVSDLDSDEYVETVAEDEATGLTVGTIKTGSEIFEAEVNEQGYWVISIRKLESEVVEEDSAEGTEVVTEVVDEAVGESPDLPQDAEPADPPAELLTRYSSKYYFRAAGNGEVTFSGVSYLAPTEDGTQTVWMGLREVLILILEERKSRTEPG